MVPAGRGHAGVPPLLRAMAPDDIAEALGIPTGPGGTQANDPYPLEMPIRVRGLAGGGNLGADAACEPFLEDTHTVLVSARGAVLRLAAPAAPGQMLTVSSPRLGTDLPARVIHYRGHAAVKGYAEIEFTTEAAGAETQAGDAAETRGQRCSAPATIAPVPVMALTDLLEEPMPAGQRGYGPFAAPAPTRRARARAANRAGAAAQRKSKTKPQASADEAMDLEALLAARKAAEQAAAQTLPATQELSLRLLVPSELTFTAPRRSRKRWLAAAAVIVLTLGAAGIWAMLGTEPALGALPQIAAFAPPSMPAEFAMRNEVRLRLPVGTKQETESLPITTQLIPPLSLLQARAAKTRPGAPAPASAAPEVPGMAVVPGGAAQPEALAKLSAAGALPAPAPPPPTGGDVAPPRLLAQASVVYPPMARLAHAEGTVVIDARIDETGRVGEMRVLSGPAIFHAAAKESLAQWRYQPALLNGRPVATYLYVTIQFKR